MKTKTSIFEVRSKGNRVEIVAGRRESNERVEITISPSKAFAFYQQLMGRRKATRAKSSVNGETITIVMHNFTPKEDSKGVSEDAKRIVVKRGDQRVTAILLSTTGRFLLAEEFKKAIKKAIEEGGKIETAVEGFYAFADKSGLRVAYKDVPVFIPIKGVTILRVAIQDGSATEVGNISWDGKKLSVKRKELGKDEEQILRGLVEVVGA